MSTVADIVAALGHESSTSWEVADAVADLDELDETTNRPLTLAQASERIYATTGTVWTPKVLSRYSATARAFPRGQRCPSHSFTVHLELRAHPHLLHGWKPTKPGEVLTQDGAVALRGGNSTAQFDPDAWKAQAKRAFGVIANVAENDPAFMIDMLEQTIALIRRSYPKALKKAGRGDLRAV